MVIILFSAGHNNIRVSGGMFKHAERNTNAGRGHAVYFFGKKKICFILLKKVETFQSKKLQTNTQTRLCWTNEGERLNYYSSWNLKISKNVLAFISRYNENSISTVHVIVFFHTVMLTGVSTIKIFPVT